MSTKSLKYDGKVPNKRSQEAKFQNGKIRDAKKTFRESRNTNI